MDQNNSWEKGIILNSGPIIQILAPNWRQTKNTTYLVFMTSV
jgi:hypothetical protein